MTTQLSKPIKWKPAKLPLIQKQFSYESMSKFREKTRFSLDSQWAGSKSNTKRIGLRKVKVYPKAYDVIAMVELQESQFEFYARVTRKTTVPELMAEFCRRITEELSKPEPPVSSDVIFQFTETTLKLINRQDVPIQVSLNIGFQKALNQVPTSEEQLTFIIPSKDVNGGEYVFENVWDRENLFFHTSFSDSSYQYICEVPQDYQIVNKYYRSEDIYYDAWFTTDGRTPINLQYDNYVIEWELYR